MSLYLVSKCKTAYSCAKSKIGCSEFCKCEGDCQNIWNVGSNIENDDKDPDEEECGSENEDDIDNLLNN